MATRVLLVAPQDGHTSLYLERAFKAEGCSVIPFDYRAAVARVGVARMNSDLEELVRDVSLRPDLVFVLKGEAVWPSTLIRLSRLTRTALWSVDPREGSSEWVLERAVAVDTFFTIARGFVSSYRDIGINAVWLLEGADEECHAPAVGVQLGEFPVSFVGTVESVPGREKWLTSLSAGLGGQLHVFGSFPGEFQSLHHGRAVGDAGLSVVVGSSVVNLGRDRNPEVERSYGARLFRTLAMGGFLLTNDTIGIRKDFSGCLGVYMDDEDCLGQCREWLLKPEEARRVALRGRMEVLGRHTFRHRVRELLPVVGL